MAGQRRSFGRWLLEQAGRDDLIGELAQGAAQDHGFPRNGDVEAVRLYLARAGADEDVLTALDDAELDWLPAGADPVEHDVILDAGQVESVLSGALRDWLMQHCQGIFAAHVRGNFHELRFEREADAAAFRIECAKVASAPGPHADAG